MRLLQPPGRPLGYTAHIAQLVWEALPPAVVETRPFRRCGALIHKHYARHRDRQQTHFTRFLRNRPQLEVLASLLSRKTGSGALKIASIGCSTGAELYSALWILRTALPGVRITGLGVDIAPDAVEVARAGRYTRDAPALRAHPDYVGEPEVKDLAPALLNELFAEQDGLLVVHDWIQEGASWVAGDIRNDAVVESLGTHDVVIANNFLGPMEDSEAETCLRNLVSLVKPGRYLIVEGVDLDLKCRVLGSIGLEPVAADLENVYFADYWKRGWPWIRWGHEPIDRSRRDWLMRYSTIFEVPETLASQTKL